MAYEGLQWTLKELPLAAGLNQGTDDRARPEPFLDICRDVVFDELGGLQTRLPFAAAAGSIFGGGTIAAARRIVRFGNERLLFTKDAIYTWNAQFSQWVLRGTHLAVHVDEAPRFETTGDQIDGDRAELNGIEVFVWTEGLTSFAAANDKTTGTVLVSPTDIGGTRPRIVALATKFLLFTLHTSTNSLDVRAIDPATPGTGIAGAATVFIVVANLMYDVVKVDGQDMAVGACRRSVTTSYTAFTVTAGLTIVTSVKARTADGPLAVASLPGGGLSTQLIRANGTNIQGDFLTTSTLADVTTGQAVGTAAGTPVNQIAAGYRSVTTGGSFRCYAFWSAQERAGFGTLWETKSNFVDAAGTIGTQAVFIHGLAPGSRAFDYAGSVYLWLTFGQNSEFQGDVALTSITQAQNAFLLYRDDGTFHAKSVFNSGGGLRASTGILPGVALISGTTTYAWCGTSKRRVALGGGSSSFAARAMRDVAFTFDSDQARRCTHIGNTLYISGGEILQFDGARLTECGFHFYPFSFDMLKVSTGSIADGTYAYKVTARWANGRGDVERSTTATIGTATMSGGPAAFTMGTLAPLTATHKTVATGAIAMEVWRTEKDGDEESPFFLATSLDPNNSTSPNQYVANDETRAFIPAVAWKDQMADATLVTKEASPENGAVLGNIAPPAASIIFATDTRLFLLGVAGDPDRGWYSKLRGAGEVAAFNDVLTFDVPRDGGQITAGWFDENGSLFVARETALYMFSGQGLDNLGQGSNYTFVRTVSLDVGCVSFESVLLTPRGTLFKSEKGWQLLHPDGGLEFIGDKISHSDAEVVLGVALMERQHRIHILTSARMLFWDYRANQWGEWSIGDGLHIAVLDGDLVYLAPTGTRTQARASAGHALDYGADIESVWIKPGNVMQGASRVRRVQLLAEYRSPFLLRVRAAYNYQQFSGGPVPGATFTNAWACNEPSGDLHPFLGEVNLVASGAGIGYGIASGPRGGSDVAIGFTALSTGKFDGGSLDVDVSATDELVVAWVGRWSALPSAFGTMFGNATAGFGNGWSVSGSNGTSLSLGLGPGSTYGAVIAGTSGFLVGRYHVGLAFLDRSVVPHVARIGVREVFSPVEVLSTSATGISGNAAPSAEHLTLGTGAWVNGNDNFELSEFYIGKGPGVASGLAVGLSAALEQFAWWVRNGSSGVRYVDDKTWDPSPVVLGGPLQIQHTLRRPIADAVKVRFTAVKVATLLEADGRMLPTIFTSLGDWGTFFLAAPGTRLAIFVTSSTVGTVEVRDGQRFDGAAWQADPGCCGVSVTGNDANGAVTLGALESAINTSHIVQIPTGSLSSPTATLDFTDTAVGEHLQVFAMAFPPGEALRFTSLGLEVGTEPGLFRRLPPGQQQ